MKVPAGAIPIELYAVPTEYEAALGGATHACIHIAKHGAGGNSHIKSGKNQRLLGSKTIALCDSCAERVGPGNLITK